MVAVRAMSPVRMVKVAMKRMAKAILSKTLVRLSMMRSKFITDTLG